MKKITIYFQDEGDVIIESEDASFGDYAYAACKLMVAAADPKQP